MYRQIKVGERSLKAAIAPSVSDHLQTIGTTELYEYKETDMRFRDKTALIAVGDSGISLKIAQLFLADGANVATTGRNQATVEAAAKGPRHDLAAATPVGKTSRDTLEQVLKINLREVFFPIQVAKPRTEKAVPRRQI
jgi:hypothetical protein